MNKIFLLAGMLLVMAFKPAFQDPWSSAFVKIDAKGRLQYIKDREGNTIPDFSRVGYHQGDLKIPNVPTVKTISPAGNNSQQLIQNAIDEVAKMPVGKNGIRGAILLKKGSYPIAGMLKISAGGIILRGEGSDAEGTKLIAKGKTQRSLLSISGTGALTEQKNSRIKIKENFVPVGSFTFSIMDARGYQPGDNIVIFRPGTDSWISDLKMDKIEAREGTLQWEAKEYDLHFERKILKIEGNKITIDNPVVMQMDNKYGGGYIYKSSFSGRIAEIGLENIYFESEYANEADEDHGWIAVSINKAENCWVRNITSRYFGYSCVSLGYAAKQVTVQDSKCFDAKSIITGGRRYSFNNDGQQNLFMNLESTEGRHDYVTGAKTLGPNVFYNCRATGTHADIGPHHRWAVGTLYDNISTDGEINVQDRGNYGTGHGWAGVTQVLWNCNVKRAAVQNPWVSGNNYSIGTQGEKGTGRFKDRMDGAWENQNRKGLTPASLYLAQLNARQIK
ncbi:hypothetical protein LPB86_05505 [Pedobacter sp. MC2016-14]|uniref:hypothetical protein n=1 Tax=Pedobacter sp. MC2016-14 TaxID=2897327 RepID=UPI001E5F2C03|nr:hypothetical protein [Pedobacter sp. MC2016-14]MCD0487673.1 hypothetical protein [Pedobacter sp. MC2016-14]